MDNISYQKIASVLKKIETDEKKFKDSKRKIAMYLHMFNLNFTE
jgi:hypothetical protein